MAKFMVTAVMATLWLSGCASVGLSNTEPRATAEAQPGTPRYRCDQGIAFTVRFTNDTAVVDAGQRGNEVLLRDAGGATPQQTVYSNSRMRAEFGLGTSGREAILRYASPPLAAHCVQE
ncbi:MAG: hypothetical protein K0Q43_806 [Ramlibacter sp.]|jgi:hypothetical protein|nr:hypothetical protein [Ramlibacter sp.]